MKGCKCNICGETDMSKFYMYVSRSTCKECMKARNANKDCLCKYCGETDCSKFYHGRTKCARCIKNDARKKRGKGGTIYFAQVANADGYVKIGYSANVYQRIKNGLFTDNPYPIRLVYIVPGNVWQERAIHDILSSEKMYDAREWFYPSSAVFELIRRIDAVGLDEITKDF